MNRDEGYVEGDELESWFDDETYTGPPTVIEQIADILEGEGFDVMGIDVGEQVLDIGDDIQIFILRPGETVTLFNEQLGGIHKTIGGLLKELKSLVPPENIYPRREG